MSKSMDINHIPIATPVYVGQLSAPAFNPESKYSEDATDEQMAMLMSYLQERISLEDLLGYFKLPEQSTDPFYQKLIGHGIHPRYWTMLNVMRIFDFAFIIDNSGSMTHKLNNPELPPNKRTRYGELLYNLVVVTDIVTALDSDGIDIYTLNKTGMRGQKSGHSAFKGDRFTNVKTTNQVEHILSAEPKGGTRLTECLEAVMYDHEHKGTTKPLVILVSTDGEPNYKQSFYESVSSRNAFKYFITFVICSDSKTDVEYLNNFDNIKSIDIIDDYKTEKKQVLDIQGKKFSYSRGDHEVRKICGPVFASFDEIDEHRVSDFHEPGPSDIPPEIGSIVIELSSNNESTRKRMTEYAKSNPALATYMRDVKQDECTIM